MSLIADNESYLPNYITGAFNLLLGRLETAEQHFQKARLQANSVDRSLDYMDWAIADLRGAARQLTWKDFLEIAKKERVSYLVRWDYVGKSWKSKDAIVAAFNFAIEQRHRELHELLFGPRPSPMPEADWCRMKEITGVTEFQADRSIRRSMTQYVAENIL